MMETMLSDDPYPIKMAWITATNPLACMGNDPRRIHRAMSRLDFIVSQDLFMTPTVMALADLVLPAGSVLERNSVRGDYLYSAWWGPVRAINKVVQVGNCKSDEEIMLDVGKRLNPDSFPWENVEQMLDWMLRNTGMTFKELQEKPIPEYVPFHYRKHEKGMLRRDGQPGFNTKNGKFNLYIPMFGKVGLDPFPHYEEPPESPVSQPDLAKEYPLILTTGARSWGFFHSEHRQIDQLREINPDPVVEIHPDTASKLGITNGAWVWIENNHGKCRQRAKLVETIDPRVVSAQHGWWYPEKNGAEPFLFGVWEHNINQLLTTGLQGASGFCAPYKSLMCKIYKAEEVGHA
jgi:anaerobic selenocysteine-containing dehydrogenase